MEILGFIGCGVMGFPMARNLARHFGQLVAWNRSPDNSTALVPFGAQVAASPAELLECYRIVIMMHRAILDAGHGGLDMIGVLLAIEGRNR